MRTPFRLPFSAILAVALACLVPPLSAQDPERDPVPPPVRETVDPPTAEDPPVVEEETDTGAEDRDASNDRDLENPPIEVAAEETPEAADESAETADDETVAAIDEHGGHEGHGHGGLHEGADHDAHGGGHHTTVTLLGKEYGGFGQFVLKLTNFLIFALLLFLMLKGALSRVFKARAKEIEMKLAQSKRDTWEAESQLRELDSKMADLEGELAGILEKAESDAETEKQRILETARAEAEQMLVQAHAEIEYQRRLAEKELRDLVSRLAVEGAEARVSQRVVGDSAVAVMDQAIRRVGGAG